MDYKTQLFSDRVRFNWGYHDGASPQAGFILANWARNFPADNRAAMRAYDKAWADGFEAGELDLREGCYRGDSTQAWEARQSRTEKS